METIGYQVAFWITLFLGTSFGACAIVIINDNSDKIKSFFRKKADCED